MRTNPIYSGSIGNIQDREAIQLQMMKVPGCSDLVSEWDWESIQGEAIRLKRLCDRNDDLHPYSVRQSK